LRNVVSSGAGVFNEKAALCRVLEKIISANDIVKTTFIIGKTAGLELLFKYILYISDKIDKSQITIFNLRDNFDYDVQNLKRICTKINVNGSGTIHRVTESIPSVIPASEEPREEITKAKIEKVIEVPHAESQETVEPMEPPSPVEEAHEEQESVEEMFLIENKENISAGSEVFEMPDINESPDKIQDEKHFAEVQETEVHEELIPDTPAEGETIPVKSEPPSEPIEEEDIEVQVSEKEFVRTEIKRRDSLKEEPVANEVYYKFETKFFEEVKILEKLFASTARAAWAKQLEKVSDRLLQSFTEIIEISSELSDLSRQLSLDITADIFFTINLFFTRAIKSPAIINQEKISLFNSSLALVNSLIKGENYLDYDKVVENIDLLRNEMLKPAAAISADKEKEVPSQPVVEKEKIKQEEKLPPAPKQEIKPPEPPRTFAPKPVVRADRDSEAVSFKMKYLVKEFEKDFLGLSGIQGEYSKFDALEKVDELNKYLRIIAKISYEVNMEDVLKLSEVSYVFLKYLKDYRMDLMELEIQQIIKYIIFTFKMLLTDRKPEDFNILVQYLNNPVKIFTDT
jgi:hypothetical protein